MQEIAVLLHNIRSAHNVGSIFRTADAAGVSKIYISGYTPSPIDRFGRPQKEILKTALGAEQTVAWECVDASRLVELKKKEGWTIIGVEQDARAVDYRSYRAPENALILFGNEVRGISPAFRNKCDVLLEIPMRGKKESLNVSVTAGIILFQLAL